jgi:DNA-binding transcriptional MerR regulator
MNIQNVTEKTGLTKRMIRHYEDLGLIQPQRGENNYRAYSESDINRLQCVKALRSIGFSLEDIGQILKEKNTEEVLRKHLQELLFKQQEMFIHQKSNVENIKKLLVSKENVIHSLLDKIANAHSPVSAEEDTLDDFLNRNRVVHGRIENLAKLSEVGRFGQDREYHIVETTFNTFAGVFGESTYTRASICSCNELFTHFILMSNSDSKFDEEYHRLLWAQFAKQWSQVAPVFAITFEAITKNMATLESLFSSFDISVSLKIENEAKEHFQIVLPAQPLLVFLKRTEGLYS